MNNDGKGYRVQRLRPTFSSPESFLSDWSCYGDSQNYGSILGHDQRSILSNNTSTYISDISRDPSDNNVMDGLIMPVAKLKHTSPSNSNNNNNNNSNSCASNKTIDNNNTLTSSSTSNSMYDEGRTSDHNETANPTITTHFIMTSLEQDTDDDDADEDDGRRISCFSAVNNPFRAVNAAKSKYTGVARNRRRHGRSKSFTNSGRSTDVRQNNLRRSSSANLLMNFEPVSELMNIDRKESTLYLI